MEIAHNLPLQLANPVQRLEDAEDPGSVHKALIDLGESLLVYITGILFGEYKKANNPVMKVEVDFYKFARQKPSFGHFLSFYRMLSGLLEQSILKDKYRKNDYQHVANLLLEWTLLKDVVDKGADSGFEALTEPLRKGRTAGNKGLQDLFDTVIIIRNIYAHPEEKAGPKDAKRKWPLNEEYFQHINTHLKEALLEVIGDLAPTVLEQYRPAVPHQLDDLNRRATFRIETAGSSEEIGLELTSEELKSLSAELRYLLGTDNRLYVQLYHHVIPSLDPSVAKQVIDQEKSKQVEPHLRQMIEDKLTNDGLLDDIEMLILRDTARTAAMPEERLFALIDEVCAKIGLEVRAGKPDAPGNVFSGKGQSESEIRFNPWWLKYFSMVPNIDRKIIADQKKLEKELKSKIKELEDKRDSLPQHEKIARELARQKELRKEHRSLESSLKKAKDDQREKIETKLVAVNEKLQESLNKQSEQEALLLEKAADLDSKSQTLTTELAVASQQSQWGMHKDLWKELNQYIDELLGRTLNRSSAETGEEWVNSPNSWQIGQLSYTYWAQIHPAKAPLGNLFHIGFAVANPFKWVPKNIEQRLKEMLDQPVVVIWTSVDDKRLERIDKDFSLDAKRKEFNNAVIEKYADRFVQMGANVKVQPVSSPDGMTGDAVDHFMSVESYLGRKNEFNIGQLYSKLWLIGDFFKDGKLDTAAIGAFESEIGLYLQFFANVISEINDYALQTGVNEEEIARREELARRHQEILFAEFAKLHAIGGEFRPEKTQLDTCREFAASLGVSDYYFEYILGRYRLKLSAAKGKSGKDNTEIDPGDPDQSEPTATNEN